MDKFTYFHCYANDLWAGYEKNGLIRDSFGIRFPESIDLPEELKFNELARVGGELYNYIKKHKCAMYVDRLQGGCFLENYPYDQALINEDKEMLGDKSFVSYVNLLYQQGTEIILDGLTQYRFEMTK